ncbi:MAG: P1 family peptidase [Chloroflexi bacterium]|nr:P1 family peptidase [Chloroflexota bacterium]
MTRARLRDLGITIGELPTGPNNAITDVPGVLVGHTTLNYDEPRVARTGVTMIVPREGDIWMNKAFAGFHSFNGNGEMTGLPWLEESGMLGSPIAITNTHQVGIVRDALVYYETQRDDTQRFYLPVVTETFDGWLNDINAFHLTREHALAALGSARGGVPDEGCVGGGTGMICHDFKGGIGTASRVVTTPVGTHTVGVLVQSNYGTRRFLRVDGVPVGRLLDAEQVPTPWTERLKDGSIIVIVATDAPLIATQCRRLAQRATVGLARVGGLGNNSSGDLFLAFATGNDLPTKSDQLYPLAMVPHHHLNVFFEAVAEATEEAILNSLTGAETTVGYRGRTAHALPLEETRRIVERYRVR